MNTKSMDSAQSPSGSPVESAVPDQSQREHWRSDFEEQLKRIDNHRAATRQKTHLLTLTAALRGLNSDLLVVEACIAQILQRVILGGMFTLQDLAEVAPAIDLQIRMARQIAQISQLEMRSTPALAASFNKPR